MRTRRASGRGYTLVEVMMSLVVLSIGATGVYSLQSIAVHANEHARDMTAAANVARWWMEQLRRDSLLWDGVNLAPTQYLDRVPPAGLGDWFTPEFPDDPLDYNGEAQTPMGREGLGIVPEGDPQGRFCGQMRLSMLRANRLIRAEVRVWWYKRGADRTLYPDCGAGAEAAMESDTQSVHWLYLVSTMEPPS